MLPPDVFFLVYPPTGEHYYCFEQEVAQRAMRDGWQRIPTNPMRSAGEYESIMAQAAPRAPAFEDPASSAEVRARGERLRARFAPEPCRQAITPSRMLSACCRRAQVPSEADQGADEAVVIQHTADSLIGGQWQDDAASVLRLYRAVDVGVGEGAEALPAMRDWDNTMIKKYLIGTRQSQTFSELMQRYVAVRTASAESAAPRWELVYTESVPIKPLSVGKLREASKKMTDERKRTWLRRVCEDFTPWAPPAGS